MKNTKLIFLALISIWSPSAFAQHEVGNGGDLVRMGFIKEGGEIINRIAKTPLALLLLDKNKITLAQLKAILSICVIGVTTDTLIDNTGSSVDSIFLNEHIWLYKFSWVDIMFENADVDQLIFHEMLRAVHFNDDNYVLSAELIPLLPPQAVISTTILSDASVEHMDEQQQQETPPESASAFSYHAASQAYFKGRMPLYSNLNGNWSLQGIAELPEFIDDTVDFFIPIDDGSVSIYDAKGILGKDLSGKAYSPHQLKFAPTPIFDGSQTNSVSMLNLGPDLVADKQGPNAMSINDLGAVFSEWSYSTGFTAEPNSTIESNAYFHFACRMLALKNNQMICAIKLKAADDATLDAPRKRFDGRTVFYLLYKKSK